MNSFSNSSNRQTVLIIDDQEQNLQVVSTVLSMTGYDVIPATSGEQAFKRLAARTPDLILLDVLMPGMDGIEVCRQIKLEPRWAELPIIFLSAADDKNLIVQALECGGVDYVTKPFNKAELLTRVRTHLALKQARDQLRNLAEDKDELLGILAHDLQNHLAGMRMSAQLLHDRVELMPNKCGTFIENIVQSTDSLLAFVKEFLANQSAERLQLSAGTVDLGEALQLAAGRLEQMAVAKKISLRLELPENAVFAKGDEDALARVLDNLGSNALKFSPSGKSVTFSVGPPTKAWVTCSVQDEGPGFTPEDQGKMFRRYGRLSARPTGGEPSTGLGLSIVKRLVEDMKGHLSVENVPTGGARFEIRLPAKGFGSIENDEPMLARAV